MSCKKHVQRKRYETCPDCKAELEEREEKTSREMLADLDLKQKEESSPELVMKKERKPRQVKEVTIEVMQESPVENISQVIAFDYDVTKAKAEIDEYFDKKLKAFKEKISSEASLTWEHLAIPYEICGLKELNELEKDGFRLVNFYQKDVAKVSGFKNDVAVFERVRKEKCKKTIEEWKKHYESKK